MERVATTRRTEPWSALLDAGRTDERLVREAFEGARPARFADVPDDLHPAVREGLRRAGVEQLYAHQAEALEAA
jgi:DEAD/DEAH box helicase domain-containing protein